MPVPGVERHLDAAAQRGDFRAHDVHADAAAGNLRDFRRGRESGLEQALDQLRLGRRRVGRRCRPCANAPDRARWS